MQKINSSFSLFVLGLLFSVTAQAADGLPNVQWSGDMRYRGVQLRESTDDTRLYQQIRARLGMKAEVQDDVTAVLRLATATSAISNNQTLGDPTQPGMPRRSFGVDLAYADWRYADSAKLSMGRVPNPYFQPAKTQLVFDHDLTFEGVMTTYQPKWTDSSAFATLGAFVISENYAAPRDDVDTGLIGLNLGYSFEAAGKWTFHASRFQYLNIGGQSITRIESGATTDTYSKPFNRFRGNSVNAKSATAYNFAYEFVQTELGFEWKMKTDDVDLTAYVDYILNEFAGLGGEAYEGGIITKVGRFQVLLAYGSKKADSVIGSFTDSDFNGGGTDNRGTKISFSYALSDRTGVVLTDYRATRGMDSTNRDYNAQHLDFTMQF